jgi:hypothetical protein
MEVNPNFTDTDLWKRCQQRRLEILMARLEDFERIANEGRITDQVYLSLANDIMDSYNRAQRGNCYYINYAWLTHREYESSAY